MAQIFFFFYQVVESDLIDVNIRITWILVAVILIILFMTHPRSNVIHSISIPITTHAYQ